MQVVFVEVSVVRLTAHANQGHLPFRQHFFSTTQQGHVNGDLTVAWRAREAVTWSLRLDSSRAWCSSATSCSLPAWAFTRALVAEDLAWL